jgi:type VI secretion system protein ImpK
MRLSDCFMEIIAYTAFVVRADSAAGLTFDQVHSNLQRLIGESESSPEARQFSREDYDLARFAVFAWVDEIILASQWQDRHQWQRAQLQRQYYQTADAGELFYERLNAIGPHQRDVREVYYLCLALGFTGQYCHAGDDFMLEQLRTSNLKLLTGSSMGLPSLDKQELFPGAYPADETGPGDPDVPPGRRWSGSVLICAAAPLLLYGLLYVIYLFILGNIGETLIGTVP